MGHFEKGRWIEVVNEDIPKQYITVDPEKMKITPLGNGKFWITIPKEAYELLSNPL